VSPELQTALTRAIIVGIPVFAVTTLGTYQVIGKWTPALVAGGLAGFTVLAGRGVAEGVVDSRKAAQQSTSKATPAPPGRVN
jgi:hypothetical protein